MITGLTTVKTQQHAAIIAKGDSNPIGASDKFICSQYIDCMK